MGLEIGKSYSIRKYSGETIIFKFLGGKPPKVEINNKIVDLYFALQGCDMTTLQQIQ